jgi:hypothetical protein
MAGKSKLQSASGVFVCVVVILMCASSWAAVLASDDPGLAALLTARSMAEARIAEGDFTGALDTLLQSVRDTDPDRAALADAAYGNGQLLSYVLLHLMPEPEAWGYLAKGFDPATYETDKLLKSLCTMAIGLYGQDKDQQTAETSYLTSSKNQIVRAIALFFLSNPYFFEGQSAFTGQYTELLSQDYPDLELTQVSLNFPLYAARETGDILELADVVSSAKSSTSPYAPWASDLRARIQMSASNLRGKEVATRADALSPLLRGVTEAPDWRGRHFSLLLLKGELEGALADELRSATRQLAHSRSNSPDVLHARVLLAEALSADCAKDPEDTALLAEVVSVAETLLESGVDVTTPERVMWETWAYGIQGCAKNLAAAGHHKEALELYAALSQKIPGSKIAAACEDASAEILSIDPAQNQVAAE